jgi:hypothetical protein
MNTAQFSKDNLDIVLRETAANLKAMEDQKTTTGKENEPTPTR